MSDLSPVEALQRHIDRTKLDVKRGYALLVHVAALELAKADAEKIANAPNHLVLHCGCIYCEDMRNARTKLHEALKS